MAANDKSLLPSKLCRHCGRPMVWRKKWRNNWDTVLYCSDACRRGVHPGQAAGTAHGLGAGPAQSLAAGQPKKPAAGRTKRKAP